MNFVTAVTGANRGIGLGFTRQFIDRGDRVVAMVRDPAAASDLNKLRDEVGERLQVVPVDVTEPQLIERARKHIQDQHGRLDLLVNNAGVMGSKESFPQLSEDDFLKVFDVNCLGAFRVTKGLLPLLQETRGNVVFITSLMGSIEDNRSGGSYPYRVSKAALNMLGKTLAEDYRERGIYSLVLHPGWVQTPMGGERAPLSVKQSVRNMIEVIEQLDEEMSGSFYSHEGTREPW